MSMNYKIKLVMELELPQDKLDDLTIEDIEKIVEEINDKTRFCEFKDDTYDIFEGYEVYDGGSGKLLHSGDA